MDILLTTKLALVDAINPCELAVEAALLAILLTKSRRSVLIGGSLFVITVYLMYLIYGLVLHRILSYFHGLVFYFLIALLTILIILEFLAYFRYKPGLISVEMPMKLRPLAKKIIEKTHSPIMAIPVAVVISLFLLPCTSGPYIIFLGLSESINWFYLLYYLFIFVSPMIIVMFLVYFGTLPEKIKVWRERHIREIHLISGILLLLVLLYLLWGGI